MKKVTTIFGADEEWIKKDIKCLEDSPTKILSLLERKGVQMQTAVEKETSQVMKQGWPRGAGCWWWINLLSGVVV